MRHVQIRRRPLYDRGKRAAPDTYVPNGHVRRFFRQDDLRKLLAPAYALRAIAGARAELYARPSAYVEVVARKT